MRKATQAIKVCLLLGLLIAAFGVWAQPAFIPNQGQWDGEFLYKTDLVSGALFFESHGYTAFLTDPEAVEHRHNHGDEDHHHHNHKEEYLSVAYRMKWVNSNKSPVSGFSEKEFYHNYFLGNDSTRWKGNVPVFKGISYKGLYKGVTINYFEDGDRLKYDILLAAHADPGVLQMTFEGLQGLEISESRLVMKTAIGPVYEYIPEAYQIINGEKVIIPCSYSLSNAQVGFKLGNYDSSQPLIIDPVLDFSTFSGATSDNWGFTATYDNSGHFYGGGITFGAGYPITTGIVQNTYGGGAFDVSITKFNPSGTALIYSTFIGGNNIDMPHSMFVNNQDELVILGSTSSPDFPVSSNGYQSTFSIGSNVGFPPGSASNASYTNGANAFIFKLNASGSSQMGSTFIGSSSGPVGTNSAITKNYSDRSRGEVIVLANGNIAVATSARAVDLPFINPGVPLATNNVQYAVVAVFNPSLSQLVWGSYFGGTNHETGYSVKSDGTDIFLCGSTQSTDLPMFPNSFEDSKQGGLDGYIAKFNGNNGQLLGATYVGTSGYDQAYFIDIDKFGSIFLFGHSDINFPISGGKYSNPNSSQFIQKYSSDLSSRVWSTAVGSGQPKIDLVPSAFMVDECLNIYLSGWGGGSNSLSNGFLGGSTTGLSVTSNAIKSTTDGSDFYFMVLDRDASGLLYGSFFGGSEEEHVDGGTSRFSPDGTIYQAVCAGCGENFLPTFPTTPGAYANTHNRSTNCNLGAIKISLEQTVQAVPDIDITLDMDTVCNELFVKFSNNSKHANKYYWDFGNGLTSNQFEPSTVYNGLGQYTIQLVAEDTVCDISDTATLTINHDTPKGPDASMTYNYVGCDKTYQVDFSNTSNEVNQFSWDFGDGSSSDNENPTHFYQDSGTYQIRLIAFDTACGIADTIYGTVTFSDSTTTPRAEVSYKECSTGELEIAHLNYRARYLYEWLYSGKKATGAYPKIQFDNPGIYSVNLSVEDPLCIQQYEQDFKVRIEAIQTEIFIPNAFSPNGDGINEEFVLSGNACNPNDYLRIFNRWGEIVFETRSPFTEFWDGTNNGEKPKEDVYTYILNTGKESRRGYLTLFM